MTESALIAWGAATASAGWLAALLARGRLPARLFLDALAIGVTLGAAVAVALAPFDLKANPLRLSPLTLAFLFAGAPEEGVKLIGVAAFLIPHYLARDRRDVVLAAGALSLGFAALENTFYLANAGSGWASLALERALTATPFHVFTGLAGGFAIASLAPGLRGAALGLLAWLALAAIHGVYDFAVFAAAPGATPEAVQRLAASVGLDPVAALRALLCAAEAAAALAGSAAILKLPARREAPRGRPARFLLSRGLGGFAGAILAGPAALALVGGALSGAILESADVFLRIAIFAAAPLALGILFVVAPTSAPPSPGARRVWAGAGALASLALATAAWAWGPAAWRRLETLRFEARGARFAALGDFRQAIDAYGQALALEPGRIDALSQRAQAYAELKRFDAALADVDAALRTAPTMVALYIERGDLDRRRNAPTAAVADLDAALRLRPGDPELLALRAEARLEAGDAASARADLSEAARAAPENAAVRRAMAASEIDAGDFDGALRDLNAALHANPGDSVAAFQRGRVWLYKADANRARADFIRADQSPKFLYPALWRFLADARLGGEAKPALQKRLAAASEAWPAPVARMLLAGLNPETARAAAVDAGEICEADFYYAMARLPADGSEASAARLRAAAQECPTGFVEYEGAKAVLRRIAP